MEKLYQHLKEITKDNYINNCLEFIDSDIYFRYDTEDSDPKESSDNYYMVQEDLREFGLTLYEPQVEHDCISGDIRCLDSRYTKQVIVIRKDLKMRRGKEIAQSCHASLGSVYKLEEKFKDEYFYTLWKEYSFTKIGLLVNSEQELNEIYKKCQLNNIPSVLITDSGRTEFNNIPTKTCIGIGPFWSFEIDKVTKHLKLY